MTKFRFSWLWAFCATLSMGMVEANPSGPTVASGSVTFDSSVPGVLTITSTSDLAIVDWDSFSIAFGETTNIVLPSSTSAILHRVTGAVAGEIDGNVTSNGIVYLINNNGMEFGPLSRHAVTSFLASTLDGLDSDFLAGGNMTFTDSTQQTINSTGALVTTTGDVVLLGYQVDQSGNIMATQGSASIGAAKQIIFQPTNPQRIVIVQGSTASTPTGVSLGSLGNISALQIEVRADGNLYTTPIDHEGTIAATGTMAQSGTVIMDATGGFNYQNGSIASQNFDSSGGNVTLLGNSITLDSSSSIDASGVGQGGQVLVGGGLNGIGTSYNSQNTQMILGAQITTDANRMGNGGQTVVWSDNTASFAGYITSRGGLQSGNGGTVQVCGAVSLNYQPRGNIDVSAVNGNPGTECPPTPTSNCNGCSP